MKRIALVAGVATLTGLATTARADCDQAGDKLFTCSVTTTQPCSRNTAGAAAAGYVCPGTETCNTGSPFGSGNCYQLRGSDTLFDVMTDSINRARAAGIAGTKDLYYLGTGSGNAENAMKASPGGSQSIGPMSRNMRPATIDGTATVPGASTGQCTGAGCHPLWAASCSAGNVIALDAAVFLSNVSGGVNDIVFPTQLNSFCIMNSAAGFNQGQKNNTAAATLPLDGGGFNNPSANKNYTSLWAIVLSGVDGSGSAAACADPRRVRAVQDLGQNMGFSTVNHVYRRDDNSGTTDTIKDRIMVVDSLAPQDPHYPFTGGRFCNGVSIGGINGATVQTGLCSVARSRTCFKDTDCALQADGGTLYPPTTGSYCTTCQAGSTEHCWFNLNNQDLDPIRRECTDDPTLNGRAYTTCTDLTTGLRCQPADNNPNCSQGLVVALSDTDYLNTNGPIPPSGNPGVGAPGAPPTDITTSIAKRVGYYGKQNAGYAGRESANQTLYKTKSLKVNGVSASVDASIRNSAYMLSRRLFLQNAGDSTVFSGTDLLTDSAAGANGTIGGATQVTAEQNLFGWMRVRSNIDSQTISKFNFITCLTDPTKNACTAPNNLCASTPCAVPPAYGGLNPTGNGFAYLSDYNASKFDAGQTTGTAVEGFFQGTPGGTTTDCTTAAPCTCTPTTPCFTTSQGNTWYQATAASVNPIVCTTAVPCDCRTAGCFQEAAVSCATTARCIANGNVCTAQTGNPGAACDVIPARGDYSACWKDLDCSGGRTCQSGADGLGLGIAPFAGVCLCPVGHTCT